MIIAQTALTRLSIIYNIIVELISQCITVYENNDLYMILFWIHNNCSIVNYDLTAKPSTMMMPDYRGQCMNYLHNPCTMKRHDQSG